MLDLEPYRLLWVLVAILTLKQVVDHIGKLKLQEYIWNTYILLGKKFGLNKNFEKWSQTKLELRLVNQQKRLISAQDQYAKWTKLNRQSDKLVIEIKAIEDQIDNDKAKVNWVFNKVILLLITLPLWFMRLWYRKSILLYLPKGVFPYPIEWILSLPFIPLGGIGLTIWMFSLNSVISSILFLISFSWSSKPIKPTKLEPKKSKIEEIN
jgi:uncharacterized protein Usg